MLYFILSFTIFIHHLIIHFNFTYFMLDSSEQGVLVEPYRAFLAKFAIRSLELCRGWIPGCSKTFCSLWCFSYYYYVIAARHGGFIVPYVLEIVVRKISQSSKVATFLDIILLIWLSFVKIETKNFNSDPCFFNLVKLGTISPAAHFINCVHIGKSQKKAAIIRGLSFGKCFVKLNRRFLRFLNYEHGKQIYKGTLKSRHWCLFVL